MTMSTWEIKYKDLGSFAHWTGLPSIEYVVEECLRFIGMPPTNRMIDDISQDIRDRIEDALPNGIFMVKNNFYTEEESKIHDDFDLGDAISEVDFDYVIDLFIQETGAWELI